MPEITREQMRRALADWRKRFIEENRAADCQDFWNEIENGDQSMYKAILAALEGEEKLIKAVKDYLEWGAMTNSDRDLHESKFREALAILGVEIKENPDA